MNEPAPEVVSTVMTMSDKALAVTEQKNVDFYGDELTAVGGSDGQIYVSIRQMCESLAIDDNGRRQRMRRQPVLNEGIGVCKLHTPGGIQDTFVLRVDLVPLWLSGIRTSAVGEAIRPRLERFQREAAKVLWDTRLMPPIKRVVVTTTRPAIARRLVA